MRGSYRRDLPPLETNTARIRDHLSPRSTKLADKCTARARFRYPRRRPPATLHRLRRWYYCCDRCPASWFRISRPGREQSMPRQRSLVTMIRDLVQQEVRSAINLLLRTVSPRKLAANGRRRRRRRRTRGTWRPGGPGRPPMAVAEKMAQKKAPAANSGSKTKTVRRRRRTRGPWRPGGPGRPPKAVAEKMAKKTAAATSASKAKSVRRRRRRRRGAGRPGGKKTKAA